MLVPGRRSILVVAAVILLAVGAGVAVWQPWEDESPAPAGQRAAVGEGKDTPATSTSSDGTDDLDIPGDAAVIAGEPSADLPDGWPHEFVVAPRGTTLRQSLTVAHGLEAVYDAGSLAPEAVREYYARELTRFGWRVTPSGDAQASAAPAPVTIEGFGWQGEIGYIEPFAYRIRLTRGS